MIHVIMPKLGLTMEEGTIIRWLKAEGDGAEKGEPLLEVQTDKVTMDVEAPASGTLGKILAGEEQIVPVTHIIAFILGPGEEPPDSWPSAAPALSIAPATAQGTRITGAVQATPAARRAARDGNVDLNLVDGMGDGGTITRDDVLRFLHDNLAPQRPSNVGQTRASPQARRLARDKAIDLARVEGTGPGGRITGEDVLKHAASLEVGADQLITPSPVKLVTAERMDLSFHSAPHFYLSVEAIASELVKLRERLLPVVQDKAGVRLTFNDLLIALVAKVVRDHPLANACWQDGRIRLWKDINIGLATAAEDGLIVPVLKSADQKTIFQIARETKELVRRAAEGKLSLAELEGGTFTLTNLGMFGVDEFAAIINPPQSAVLAVGGIAERPVVEGGQVVARPTIRLTLSVDHRVWDGAEGARFLNDLKILIEQPQEAIRSGSA